MLDITNIPPPRVPFIDERTGLMAREWYLFLLNLFKLTGGGTSSVSIVDLQSQIDLLNTEPKPIEQYGTYLLLED